MPGKIRAYRRESASTQWWFVVAWLVLAVSRLLVAALPFRIVARHLGKNVGIMPFVPLLTSEQETRANQIGRVIRLVVRHSQPGATCFPQAVAARILLGSRRVPYALHFGLARDSESSRIRAHAWVAAGRVNVPVSASFGVFTIVSTFVNQNSFSELQRGPNLDGSKPKATTDE